MFAGFWCSMGLNSSMGRRAQPRGHRLHRQPGRRHLMVAMPAPRCVRRRVYSDQRDSQPRYSCTPSTSRPKHLRSSIAGMDPATGAASGTEDQPCNGDTNPCIGQVTGQYEHGDVDEEYRREPRPRQGQPEPALRLHWTPLRSRHGTLHMSECPAHRDAIAHRSQSCVGRTLKGC